MRSWAGRLAISALVGTCIGPLVGIQGASALGGACTDRSVAVCNLWVSSTGNNDNDGLSPATPLRSLQRANDLLCRHTLLRRCAGIGKTVKVNIAAGTYPSASTVWSYSDPTYATQIIGQGVVMDGRFATEWGLHIAPKNSRSNIQVFHIKWTRYLRGGMTIGGGDNNRIYHNTFYRIGSYYSKRPEIRAYAGIYLIDSKYNSLEKSVFVSILNAGTGYGNEHGVYIVRSTNNQVTGNTFSNVGGDPIRVRDAANHNRISGNAFINSGALGYIGDWRCLRTTITACPDGDESLSWNNSFKDNVLKGPHPWHLNGFKARYCYDLRGWCPSQRIAG
jgi:hypothetical protein